MSENPTLPDIGPAVELHDPTPASAYPPQEWFPPSPVLPSPVWHSWGQAPLPTGQAIARKIAALRVAIGSIAKDKTGHGYKYTSNEATLNEIRPALDELNLVANEEFTLLDVRDHQGKGWITWVKGTLYVTDIETGQYIVSSAIGSGYDTTDKGSMKAMTAADKYNWWKLLQISTPDDPEVPNDVEKAEKASRTFVEPRSKSGSPGAPVSAPKPPETDQTQIQKAEQILAQKTYAPFDRVEVKVSQKGTHYARVIWRNAAATVFGPNVDRVQGLWEAQKNVYLTLEDSKGPGARPGDMIVKSLSVEGDE